MATQAEKTKTFETTRLIYKNNSAKTEWERLVAGNINYPPGKKILEFACRWAKHMQILMEDGNNLADIARKAASFANTDNITKAQYVSAVALLKDCWIHGEELENWHFQTHSHFMLGDFA